VGAVAPPPKQSGSGRAPAPSPPAQNGGNGNDPEIDLSDKSTLKEVAKIAQRKAERQLIEKVLQQTRWNRRKAAQILDISYKALLYKIKECGLSAE
jgi:two-component system response regulator AtoC